MSTSGNNNNEESSSRKGKGRRKVTMAKMENESNLQVTFSKRRNGLFKKASELSIRCGAETALVVFSPGDKPYSFGHPSVETVATRFLVGENDQNPTADHYAAVEAERQMIANSTAELNQAVEELDVVKSQAKELDQMVKQLGRMKHIKESNSQQLNQLKEKVLHFKSKLDTKDGKDNMSFTGTPYGLPGPNPNLIGSSTHLQPAEPNVSSFDPLFGSSQQGLPNQFPHCYGSTVESNIFGNNFPVASYDPSFAGTSTTDFLAPPGYYNNPSMWNSASSSFVIPCPPPSNNPTATIPIHSTDENQWSTGTRVPGSSSGGAREDGDEYRFQGIGDSSGRVRSPS